MMDFASTPAHAKGVAPAASREEGGAEAAVARCLNASSLPTADGVDKMYHHMTEIHDITATPLAECTHWHQSNPTPNMAHAGASWRGLAMVPSVTSAAPSPPTDISPQASLRQRGPHAEPQVHRRASQSSAQHERRTRDPHHDKLSSQRRHGCDPKAARAEVHRSGSHDVPLMLPSQALADIISNTIKEPRGTAAQYVASNEATQLHPSPSSSKGASTKVTT
jgi:hypothetical protein